MRLRQLEYFIAICDAGSFNGAASELRVAQPSLSQQIQALEKELGAELLERGRQGISLTAAGRLFLPQARAVLASVESARKSVADLVAGVVGELHVLTVRSVASGVLPAGVVRWHEHHPTTVLRLHDYSHRRDLEAAMRGRAVARVHAAGGRARRSRRRGPAAGRRGRRSDDRPGERRPARVEPARPPTGPTAVPRADGLRPRPGGGAPR